MERYTPPFVAPKRSLSADDLKKRGFGEALYTQLTPEQRQQTLILKDADELGEFITRREEAMAAETMLTNGCIMKHIADDADESDEMEIRFYSEGSNPATYALCDGPQSLKPEVFAPLAAKLLKLHESMKEL